MKNIDAVIIQAGGSCTRMGKFCKNKPKLLLPYKGKTVLENNLQLFLDKKIIIICDYLSDVIKTYSKNILNREDLIFIESKEKSTSSGIDLACSYLNESDRILIIWSDLFFTKNLEIDLKSDISVGISNEIECRWEYSGGTFTKKTSYKNGVVGVFAFSSKKILEGFDTSKSFVGFNLLNIKKTSLESFVVDGAMELGSEKNYNTIIQESSKCRFFNRVDIFDNFVEKRCLDPKFEGLNEKEIGWYKYFSGKIPFIPKLLGENPLKITRIFGDSVFNIRLNRHEKEDIMHSIFFNLHDIHRVESIDSNQKDIEEVYLLKTISRINSIKSLIPFFDKKEIRIDGKTCLNPFHCDNIGILKGQITSLSVNKFYTIHGDPTFSNIIVDKSLNPFFIDPRGYFGQTQIYGDKNYDWAKLYYSVVGNYDSINSKKFEVKISSGNIETSIQSNEFEEFGDSVVFSSGIQKKKIQLIHSLIWLSLSGYVKEDIDSVLYSFFYGTKIWNLTI